jgi:pyruvate/2-oxoglutarate dehydrogenase complex dihydrolipoamide dehydrogenase (E3) component
MTNDLITYDLVVTGGGPAGVTAATVASSFGKSVALVDSHQEIGGAGINTGTVPSKTLRERRWPCQALSHATSMESIFRYAEK